MYIRAYGLNRGDIFIYNDRRYTHDGLKDKTFVFANSANPKIKTELVSVPLQQIVEVIGSVFPSRDELVKSNTGRKPHD